MKKDKNNSNTCLFQTYKSFYFVASKSQALNFVPPSLKLNLMVEVTKE